MIFVQLATSVLKVHIVLSHVHLDSFARMWQWPHLREIVQRAITAMIVPQFLTSLAVQLGITVHLELVSHFLVLRGNFQILPRIQNLRIVEIVPLGAFALGQEIQLPQSNVLQGFTAPVAKAQRHQQITRVHQVISAKEAHHSQSGVKMEHSKTNVERASATPVQKVITVMPPMQLW